MKEPQLGRGYLNAFPQLLDWAKSSGDEAVEEAAGAQLATEVSGDTSVKCISSQALRVHLFRCTEKHLRFWRR
jgi:hypothetical protein